MNLLKEYDFNAQKLQQFLNYYIDPKIQFTTITNWYPAYPYYRLNYYVEIQISQVPGIYLLFNEDFLSQFSTIIEIGSYNGGLSSYIYNHKQQTTKFVSYDIDASINDLVNKKHISYIDFRISDCFNEKTFQEIISLINLKGKTLLICDGGNKVREFQEFSKYLKPNDIILAHDYQDSINSFKEFSEYWQWPYGMECSYNDIKDYVTSNNLSKFNYDKFLLFLWGAFIKNE